MIGQANNIGDEIKFTLDPITNVSSINSFIDSITGETSTRFFKKYFRYAIEGLFFTEYRKLSNINLQSISIENLNSVIIEILYVRDGSDDTGVLYLDSIEIFSTQLTIDNGYEYDHSNFAKFFDSNDVDVEKWTLNVLKKIFEYGQLATFVLRGKNLSLIVEENEVEQTRRFDNLVFHHWESGNLSEFN